MVALQTVYRSSNGDDWQIERSASGNVIAVVHQANLASGGKRTRMLIDEFLERSGSGPEVAAVVAAIGP